MHALDEQLSERLFHFRRRFHASQRRTRGLLVSAAWVNVILLMLLFFITQSAFVVQPGVVVELPASTSHGHARFGDLVVAIPQEGMFFFNDERMTEDRLAHAMGAAARENPERALIVEADQRIAHQTLMDVYNMAVSAGLRQVLLATRSPVAP